MQQPAALRPVAGTIVLSSLDNNYTVAPAEGREIVVGRNAAEVHLGIGVGDLTVSRRHLLLHYEDERWWVRRVGKREARLGTGRRLWRDGEPVALPQGYTSLVVDGAHGRVHVVEVAIAGPEGWGRPSLAAATLTDGEIQLDDDERLVIAAIGETYLRGSPDPRPLAWARAEAVLAMAAPDRGLTRKQIEHKVTDLRLRLSAAGHPGLVTPESPSDQLTHNLVMLLIAADAIGPADLALVDPDDRAVPPSGTRDGAGS